MDKLTIFMSAEEKARALSNYTLVDQNSPSYAENVRLYPVLAQEAVYVLNEIDSTETAWLNPVMGQSCRDGTKLWLRSFQAAARDGYFYCAWAAPTCPA